jgi:GntR family transcriptional regulator
MLLKDGAAGEFVEHLLKSPTMGKIARYSLLRLLDMPTRKMPRTPAPKPSADPEHAARGVQRVDVAATLRGEIQNGRHAVGALLPTEAELQQRFRASRYAIREALRELKEEGFIQARAGIGTVVRTNVTQKRTMSGEGLLENLTTFAEASQMRVIARHAWVADSEWAAQFGGEPKQMWSGASILRFVPGQTRPIALLQLFVAPEHGDVFEQVPRTGGPVFALLESDYHVRIADVRQQIIATSLDATSAVLLEAPLGSPTLNITRHYMDDEGKIVLLSIGLYPSDRFTHDTRFRLSRG